MKKFVPYEKMQKKQKKDLDRKRRGSWGDCNPITKKEKNEKAYDRNKYKGRNTKILLYA